MGSNLVSVKYIGRHPAVEVDPDGFGEITVVKGDTIDVPAEAAALLLEQVANWERVSKPVTSAKAEEAK